MSTPRIITVTGTLFNVSGQPTSGTVQFLSPVNVSHNDSDDLMVISSRSVIAGSDGEISIPIPCSNDPAWSPSSWTWQIKLKTEDHTLVWNAVVPYNAPLATIALNELAPVPQANGELYALINHTHSGFVTEAELADAIDTALGNIEAGSVTSVNGQTGVVTLTKSSVGLGNVTNTADPDKPVSNAQQTALDSKVSKTGDTMTGDLTLRDSGNTKGYRFRSTGGALDLEFGAAELWIAGKSGSGGDPFGGTQYLLMKMRSNGGGVSAEGPWEFNGAVTGIDKADVGLTNVDDTSDANKPVSTPTQNALALKADTSALSGYATLVGGVIPTSQIPAVALSEFMGTSANQAAMLAKPGQLGDWTIRTDTSTTWFITGSDPTQLANWTQLVTPSSPVQSVNGQTGVVTLSKSDIGLGNLDNTSDVNKPLSTADTNALALKAPLASPTFTGTVSGITKSMVGLGNLDNTSDVNKPVSTAQAIAIAAMVDPSELATALGPYATTSALTTGLAGKLDAVTTYLDALYGNTNPTDHSLIGWTFDPYAGVQGGVVLATAGLAYSVRIRVLRSTITNINMHFTTAGATLTAGQCFAAVYSDTGTLLGTTVDQATNWASSGYKTCALSSPITGLTPYTWVRVVWWFNGTTGPTLSRAINSNTAITNAGMTSNFRSATANTALTTTAPGTLGTLTGFLTGWWIGLS